MSLDPLLILRDVHHTFGAGATRKKVLHGIHLDLQPGEIVILTGPSGSGKTTILTLAGALRRVQAGDIVALGSTLTNASHATLLAVRRRIGFIFQQPNLLESLTALENVQLALAWSGAVSAAEAGRRARMELEAVGLADHLDHLPSQLSGGQRQRVAVARALVTRPQLILADEPTSALDRTTGREVIDLLQQLTRRNQCAILLVTHDHRILNIADRHIALEDGRLVSLAREASQQTDQVLAGLAQASRAPDLAREIAGFDEPALFRFLAESTDDLARLCRVIDAARTHLATSLLDRLLIAASFKAGQWLNAERVTLFLVDWSTRTLRSRVAQTNGQGMLEIELSVDTGIAGYVARTGETVNLADAYDSPLFQPEVDERTGFRTRGVLCMPMRKKDSTIFGVAQLLNKKGAPGFSSDDEKRFDEFLQPLGGLLLQVLATEAALQVNSPSQKRNDTGPRQIQPNG